MGQQQLLLVILVTIIVGIATVVAINIFGSAAEQANKDAVRQDLLAASAQAQGIYARPEMMGGAGGDFSSLTVIQIAERIGIPGEISSEGVITNENAEYTISDPTELSLTITGVPTSAEGDWIMTVTEYGEGTTTAWTVSIQGDGETNIIGQDNS